MFFVSLFWYFPNLGKARELNLCRRSAFMLPVQTAVEKIKLCSFKLILVCGGGNLWRIYSYIYFSTRTAVAQWLRCCATNRKGAGSNPDGVIVICHWIPGAFPGGRGSRYVRLTNVQLSCAVVTKSGNLNFLEHSGPVQSCNALPLRNGLHSTVLCR
jgi:hypothetical protein